jgi:hypothetical protein
MSIAIYHSRTSVFHFWKKYANENMEDLMGKKKSKNIEDKIGFVNRIAKCSPKVRLLFEQLRDQSIISCVCDDWGYTDKPDFRLACHYTICELVPMIEASHVLVFLRIDRRYPTSFIQKLKTVEVSDVSDPHRPGSRWITFSVGSPQQITEAVLIIKEIYVDRLRYGW